MAPSWNILVVDDAEDVHHITRLALKRKSWRGRPFVLEHAQSGKEARAKLSAAGSYHCVLVDVSMESESSGLELCDFIRVNCPRSTRIILRTGNPASAAPIEAMNDYDIDYYLAKPEATGERLYSTLRACFRSALDLATLDALAEQQASFLAALEDGADRASFVSIMVKGISFLEEKYFAEVVFVDNASGSPLEASAFAAAIAKTSTAGLPPAQLHPAPELDGARAFVVLVPSEKPCTAGVGVRFEEMCSPTLRRGFTQDLSLFVGNWRSIESALRLRDPPPKA